MKISHESPLTMLEKSRKYNDYDYALVHLFEIYPEYFEFFKESLKMGRTVYLDNSIFELGTAFDMDKFIEYVELFRAINDENFYYIVPDVLEDCEATIENFKKFKSKYTEGNTIGVVQGKNWDEIVKCFTFMRENADIVAISFDYSYYLELAPSKIMTKVQRYALGRAKLIGMLRDAGLLENTKVHLLGCGIPQEFKAYKDIPEIISLDTSNPVVHGILGVQYNAFGLTTKESTKLVDLIEYQGDQDLIEFNIRKFRELNEL